LRHKESNRIRVLMRQEKTMKVLTNFFLDPRIHLVPNAGNDKSWVWNCFDFAEGELLETVRLSVCTFLIIM
jgi:Ran-binding protein 1